MTLKDHQSYIVDIDSSKDSHSDREFPFDSELSTFIQAMILIKSSLLTVNRQPTVREQSGIAATTNWLKGLFLRICRFHPLCAGTYPHITHCDA